MMKKLNLNLLILVTLIQRTRGDFVDIKEQEKIGSKSRLIQTLVEYLPETVITPVVTVGGEKINDNKVRGLGIKKCDINDDSDDNNIKNSVLNLRVKREEVIYPLDDALHCLSCFANGSAHRDQNCYKAQNIPSIKCATGERCYSELNSDYVRRGCKLKSLLNRTHVCKCPFCNDKPFDDASYYDYKNVRDWKYDNERLEMPLVGIDLICKMCDTNGTNTNDKICKIGKNANFTACERNQLCYTNVDGNNNQVSRGCIDRPKYNSIYFFCHTPLCNNKTLYNFRSLTKKLRIFDLSSSAFSLTKLNFISFLALYSISIFYEFFEL